MVQRKAEKRIVGTSGLIWLTIESSTENSPGRWSDYNWRYERSVRKRKNIERTTGKFGDGTINASGKKPTDFCTHNNLRILNTFSRHKKAHKHTWESRGSTTTIEYIIARGRTAKGCQDVRTYRGYCIGSDHYLVKGTFNIQQEGGKTAKKEKRLNIRWIDDPVNRCGSTYTQKV